MGVVHHNRHTIRRRHHLEPARHLRPRSRASNNLFQSQPPRQRRTRRRKQVIHIHSPRQRRSSPCIAIRRLQQKPSLPGPQHHSLGSILATLHSIPHHL